MSAIPAGGSGFQTGFLAHLYPDEGLALVSHQLAFAVLGLLVVIATRGRLGAGRAPDGTPSRSAAPQAARVGADGESETVVQGSGRGATVDAPRIEHLPER